MRKTVYSCAEIAQKYKVHIQTVWSWVRLGKLKAYRAHGERDYKITQESLREFEKTLKYKT